MISTPPSKRACCFRVIGIAITGVVICICLLSAAAVTSVMIYRAVDPPRTPLMNIRASERKDARTTDYRWQRISSISPNLWRAVIASEDAQFCSHNGFDWDAIRKVLEEREKGGSRRGGSTISQQTAKNAFLWPERNFLRKGLEAGFTFLIEILWSKRRIMEIYLNIAEWGPGIYGAEAAARRYFHRPASRLTPMQAALLVSVLPNPLNRNPARPSRRVQRKARIILKRMATVRPGRNGPCPQGAKTRASAKRKR